MKVTTVFCDFNPNAKQHEADFSVAATESGVARPGEQFDACGQHLGRMVAPFAAKHEVVYIRRLANRKPEIPVDMAGAVSCPECDEFEGVVNAVRTHLFKRHGIRLTNDEIRALNGEGA